MSVDEVDDRAGEPSSNRILDLISSGETGWVFQAFELAVTLDDDEMLDPLLSGVEWSDRAVEAAGGPRQGEGPSILALAAIAGKTGHSSVRGIRSLGLRTDWWIEEDQTRFIEGLAAWPDLEVLHLTILPKTIVDLSALAGAAKLRELHLYSIGENWALKSTQVTGIEAITGLDVFSIGGTTAPRAQFAPGARFPEDGEPDGIVISYATNDLGNIAEVPGIKAVYVRPHGSPLNVDVLAKLPDLRIVDIRKSPGVTDVSALAGHPELRIIAAYESGIDPAAMPDELVPFLSFAKNPKLSFDRKRPSKKKKSSKATGITASDAWPAVVSALTARSLEDAIAGAEKVIELGPEAIEEVLSKISLDKGGGLRPRVPVRVDRMFIASFVGKLLEAAPSDSENANRLREAHRLFIEGKRWSHGPREYPHLQHFPNLKQLVVRKVGRGPFDFTHLPVLEELVVATRHGFDLAVPQSLKRLLVERGKINTPENLTGSNVEDLALLEFWDPAPVVEAFERAQLRRVSLLGKARLAIPLLVDHPLVEVETSAQYLASLVGHPTLERVVVEPGSLDAVPAGLRSIAVEQRPPTIGDWLTDLS